MMRLRMILATILVLTFSVAAIAQDKEKEQRWRNFEFSATGGLSIPTGTLKTWNDSMGAKTGYDLGGTGGYYLNDRVSLGAYFLYGQHSMKLYSMHYRQYDFGGYVKYAFTGESNFEPYLRLSAGVDFAKFPTWVGPTETRLRELSYNPALSLGLSAGLLYFTSDYGGLFLEASYRYAAVKDRKSTYQDHDYFLTDNVNNVRLNAGISVFFGSEK